jgi:hypothetical protein
METKYYPTGNGTGGRTLVCLCCEADKPFFESGSDPKSVESTYKEWMDSNNYCVEKWQLEKEITETCGCTDYVLEDMGGDIGGGSFASLDTVSGMGAVQFPSAGGTNADFYGGTVGSGDKFPSLNLSSTKKKRKKSRIIKEFNEFLKSMKNK